MGMDEYYDEEVDYDDEYEDGADAMQRAGRMLSPEQEDAILRDLTLSAQRNKEFLKVLSIL